MNLHFRAPAFFPLTKVVCGFFAGIAVCACCGLLYAEEPWDVLAKVNGVPITFGEVEEEINVILSRTVYHTDVPIEKREAFRKEAVEKLIEKELEFQEAERRGVTADKEEVKERLEEIRKKFPSEKAFKEALKKKKITVTKYEEMIKKALLIEKVVNAEVQKKVTVSDDEVKAYYEKNTDKFKEPEKIKIRHIVIMFDPSKGSEDTERARAKAGEILKKARSGEDFAALAREYSEDAYKEKGGDLGYVARGSMDPEIEKAVFGLQPGEIMGPVETKYGFYLVRVEDKKPESMFSFDEVKGTVRKKLEGKKTEERMAEWVASMREKAKIEYTKQGTDTTERR